MQIIASMDDGADPKGLFLEAIDFLKFTHLLG